MNSKGKKSPLPRGDTPSNDGSSSLRRSTRNKTDSTGVTESDAVQTGAPVNAPEPLEERKGQLALDGLILQRHRTKLLV